MIRTQVIPDSNNVSLAIPDSYIGKKVEIILFSDEDLEENGNAKGKIKKYKGALSKKKALEMQEFAMQIRKEWDREF